MTNRIVAVILITSLLLAESERTGSVGLGGFWARRARRLLPALAVLVVRPGPAYSSSLIFKLRNSTRPSQL